MTTDYSLNYASEKDLPVIDREKKFSYRWIWVPVNDAGEMRFFILSRMYPVSFKFDFWWI
jgi:hypothetical protein